MTANSQPARSERVPCETADCQNRAEVYLTCEGEGAYPYCGNCAGVLRRVGEEERGAVPGRLDAHCSECPFADRGDWVMYRDEYEALVNDRLAAIVARENAEAENRRLQEARARIIAHLVEMADVLDQDDVARTAETLRRAAAVLGFEEGQ
jgi:hypothetical protein